MNSAAMATCACCGATIPTDVCAVELGTDGLPLAAAIIAGLGLPVIDPFTARMKVRLDGVEQVSCVGYSRPLGKVWRHQIGVGGRFVLRDGALLVEAVHGAVTLELVA